LFDRVRCVTLLAETPPLRDLTSAGSFEGSANGDVQMNNAFFRRVVLGLGLAAMPVVFASVGSAQYTNGIYAEFNTSRGSFTCRLEYATAPKAAANFIGLATGHCSWLDLASAQVKTNPFYNGTTFHRVIAGFMIQGGSPNGLGNDGPGYAFIDEFSPSLRFNSYGVLAMANSGPDSNGSQYFITATNNTAWLNDLHTIFGRFYGGSNVVHAINHVATDANDKPLTNVVLQSLNIRRVGTAAQAFDIKAQGLPLVTNLNLKIARAGTNVSLTFSNRLYADNRLYASSNLTSWSGTRLGIEITAPVTNSVTQSAAAPYQFFRAMQIQYPSSTWAPKTVYGRTAALTFTNGAAGTLTIVFDSTGGGTYTLTGLPAGTVDSYSWYQEPYNGELWPIYFSDLIPMTLALNFSTTTAGSFTGTAYPDPYTSFPIGGTFTLH
jgi:peptidyl-prolyl cis-trans isomerase A (cyclophilin A)